MRTQVLFVLAASVLVLGSCDMFRKIAGRPTSDEIEQKRQEIVAENLRVEELKRQMKAQADSLAIVDSLRKLESNVRTISEVGELYTTALDHRYYVILGSFKQEANAQAFLKKVSNAGYVPILISFNGFSCVGVNPADTFPDAYLSLKSAKREDFCPSDAWILYNKR